MIKILKRFYQFLLVYKGRFWLFCLTVIVANIVGNIGPFFYKLLIDVLPNKQYDQILRILFLFVGARLLSNWLSALSRFLGDRVLISAIRDVRIKIFCYLQDLGFAFHVNQSTGSLISAFKRGDGAFGSLFHDLHLEIGGVLISLLVLLFFFTGITWTIALLVLLIFIINIFLSWRLLKINIRKRAAFNQSEDELSAIITDNLINYETVKFFAQETKEEGRLRFKFKDWSAKMWSYANSFRMVDIGIGTTSSLGALLVFWIVARRLVAGQLGVGDFVMVASFMTGFYFQFFRLFYHVRNIAKNFTDLERYFGILDQKIQVRDPAKPIKPVKIKGRLEFQKVSFAYPDDKKPVLKDFDLLIKAHDSVAFVGRSGAGKTTLIRLLLRFYDVTAGQIMVDGVEIKRMAKTCLRRLIGIVPQEPLLFNQTIGYNIRYGLPGASRQQMIKAAKMANLHDFIMSLPKNYQTYVGERGIKLSGGQKQRLAIARMLLINPKIIIFDEATSNLDSESEKLIQDALWKIARNRTVLIIAHRFATVQRASRIVVIDQGEIVEQGTHQDLIKQKSGLYQYLWELQARGHQKDPELLKV